MTQTKFDERYEQVRCLKGTIAASINASRCHCLDPNFIV
jgi:hypothetical protein